MKTLCFIIYLSFTSLIIFAQIPAKIDFQAVARDAQGAVMAQKPISIQIFILAKAPSGSAVYTELHKVTTDEYGLFALAIGNGQNNQGVFSEIKWDEGPHFVQVKVDPDGSNNYLDLGTLEMMAVPYAFYAQNVENADDADADPKNEIQELSVDGEVLTLSKSNFIQLPDASTTNELQQLAFGTDNVLSISGGNSIQLPNVSSPWSQSGVSVYRESGRVGIGLTKPSNALSIFSENRATMNFLTSGSGSGQEDGFAIGLSKLSNSAMVWNYEQGDIRFGTNDETRMYINQFGRVGIGTTAPGERVEIAASNQDAGLRIKAVDPYRSRLSLFQNTTSGGEGFSWEYDGQERALYLRAEGFEGYGGNELMTIIPQGAVGINTDQPQSTLSVNERDGMSTILTLTNDQYNQARLLIGLHEGKPILDFKEEPFTIRAEGHDVLTVHNQSRKVGIGVLEPRVELEIDGRLLVSEKAEVEGSLEIGGSLRIGQGASFDQIIEHTGTTAKNGDVSNFSYPPGYTKNNTRVLSAEIQHPGGAWMGVATGTSLDRIRVVLLDDVIRLTHPPLNDYQSQPIRLLLFRLN